MYPCQTYMDSQGTWILEVSLEFFFTFAFGLIVSSFWVWGVASFWGGLKGSAGLGSTRASLRSPLLLLAADYAELFTRSA